MTGRGCWYGAVFIFICHLNGLNKRTSLALNFFREKLIFGDKDEQLRLNFFSFRKEEILHNSICKRGPSKMIYNSGRMHSSRTNSDANTSRQNFGNRRRTFLLSCRCHSHLPLKKNHAPRKLSKKHRIRNNCVKKKVVERDRRSCENANSLQFAVKKGRPPQDLLLQVFCCCSLATSVILLRISSFVAMIPVVCWSSVVSIIHKFVSTAHRLELVWSSRARVHVDRSPVVQI